MDDIRLVEAARSGDAGAREALARAWLPLAYGAALAVLGRAADAEDAAQDGLLKAFAGIASLRSADRFGPWLLRILRNSAVDILRRRRPTEEPLETGRDDPEPAEDGAVTAWRGLPEDERFVVWLSVVQGVPIREIARLLGTSKSSVDRTYRRGLARMRREVARC